MTTTSFYSFADLHRDLILAIKDEFGFELDFSITSPKEFANGDVTTNAALKLAGYLAKQNGLIQDPISIGKKVFKSLQNVISRDQALNQRFIRTFLISEVVNPGFINFWFSDEYLFYEAKKYLIGVDNLDLNSSLVNKTVIIEYTDPNPFKEFHIGHLYSNVVGEAIARLKQRAGAKVIRVCYQGDVGMHVAKSLYGMRQQISNDYHSQAIDEALLKLSKQPASARAKFLGLCYVTGAKEYEQSVEAKSEIQKINAEIYDFLKKKLSARSDIEKLYVAGRKWSLKYFESLYEKLGMKFDDYFFESQVSQIGEGIVREYLAKGVFELSNGAVIFPASKYHLHDRVFINSLGLPTYEAKELGLAPEKFKRYTHDSSIIITGNEIVEYFKVLLKAMSLTNPDLAKLTTHLAHGMVKLPEGKMSSRKGNVITGEWLIDQSTSQIMERLSQTKPDLDQSKRSKIALIVAMAGIKYSLLKSNIGDNVAFSFTQSLSFSGNSGPYLQYTAVRCYSVIKKAAITASCSTKKLIDTLSNIKVENDIFYTKMDKVILRYIAKYIDVLRMASEQNTPHLLANYLYSLSSEINRWYDLEKIIESEQFALTDKSLFKLLIAKSCFEVIKHGLDILGINIPEEM